MSAPFLIVDGYNLLHAAGLSQARYAPGDLHRQRHRLLVHLAGRLTGEERLRSTVVFDAKEAPTGLHRQTRWSEITVLFAEPGHDADTLIESIIETHPAPKQLLVVSSDHRLQKAAQHKRAACVGSEEFLEALAARARNQSGAAGKPLPDSDPASATGDDVSYWLLEFGEIDVEALARGDDPDLVPDDPWQRSMEELQKRLDHAEDLDDWLDRPPDRSN